jgi:thiol-disulfide isomerase/thioredoxin
MEGRREVMAHKLILYVKPGCHLCDIVYQLLEGLHRDADFDLEKIDITTDPDLVKEYGAKIPVLVVDDRSILCTPIRLVHVRAALAGRLDGSSPASDRGAA